MNEHINTLLQDETEVIEGECVGIGDVKKIMPQYTVNKLQGSSVLDGPQGRLQ